MPQEYSIYDAKAHLSALVRQVREASTFVITVRGEPVAELRPITKPDTAPRTLAKRISDLRASGEIIESQRPRGVPLTLLVAPDVAGALQRFLENRE